MVFESRPYLNEEDDKLAYIPESLMPKDVLKWDVFTEGRDMLGDICTPRSYSLYGSRFDNLQWTNICVYYLVWQVFAFLVYLLGDITERWYPAYVALSYAIFIALISVGSALVAAH